MYASCFYLPLSWKPVRRQEGEGEEEEGELTNPPSISNFGTLIIQGFGFTPLVTTLMQIPYGAIIALSILLCVFANEYVEKSGRQARSWFILLFLAPNIAGAFGLAFLEPGNQAGRLVSYYLTGPYNAAFVMVLSLSTANTAGHTKKVVTNGEFCFFLFVHQLRRLPHPQSAERYIE